ncbi:MAG: zinc ribbon domain-containing protein [Clostridia bacterium]|jgi:uncharacterized membrane protein|nr:zinc ribbon domain-containing protein [Clostridia bacterium]
MKVCPQCRISYNDSETVCGKCGGALMTIEMQPAPAAPADMTDHTAEFDPADISQNKVVAMVPYLLGWIGIIIALLASGTSPYASFHVRQALKIQICSVLAGFLAIIPILGWIAMGICAILAVVINLIGFFDVCRGMAREPLIISKFGFLR